MGYFPSHAARYSIRFLMVDTFFIAASQAPVVIAGDSKLELQIMLGVATLFIIAAARLSCTLSTAGKHGAYIGIVVGLLLTVPLPFVTRPPNYEALAAAIPLCMLGAIIMASVVSGVFCLQRVGMRDR